MYTLVFYTSAYFSQHFARWKTLKQILCSHLNPWYFGYFRVGIATSDSKTPSVRAFPAPTELVDAQVAATACRLLHGRQLLPARPIWMGQTLICLSSRTFPVWTYKNVENHGFQRNTIYTWWVLHIYVCRRVTDLEKPQNVDFNLTMAGVQRCNSWVIPDDHYILGEAVATSFFKKRGKWMFTAKQVPIGSHRWLIDIGRNLAPAGTQRSDSNNENHVLQNQTRSVLLHGWECYSRLGSLWHLGRAGQTNGSLRQCMCLKRVSACSSRHSRVP